MKHYFRILCPFDENKNGKTDVKRAQRYFVPFVARHHQSPPFCPFGRYVQYASTQQALWLLYYQFA